MINLDFSDCVVLGSASFNFILFLALHIILLRLAPVTATAQAMRGAIAAGGVGTVVSFTWLLATQLNFGGQLIWIILIGNVVAILLYGLLVFHYLALIFGMGESAIRVRLLRELEQAAKKLTLEEICHRYNVEKILEIRLTRLTSTNHLSFDGTFYYINKPILLAQVCLTRLLRYLLGMVE